MKIIIDVIKTLIDFKTMMKHKKFDSYIWQCFFRFLNKEGKYKNYKNDTFYAYDAENRNPEQVPELLWQKLIQRHVKTFNNN